MMTPYLAFSGTCEEALTAYAAIFGGTIESMNRFAGSPMEGHVPADYKQKVMHATLSSPLGTLMAADQAQPLPEGTRVSISITPAASDGERIFNELSRGGAVGMPLQDVFWGGRFGMLTDRFGIDWLISIG